MMDGEQAFILVNETQEEVEFTVLRTFGTFGEVSVMWSITPLGDDVMPGQDYLDE